MLSVYGWVAHPDATCYYRAYLPIGAMTKLGLVRLTSACGTMMSTDLASRDVIVGQRQALPNNSAEWTRLAESGKPLVFELDDDLWSLPDTNPAKKLVWDRPGMMTRLELNLGYATCATASTEPLAKVMRQFNHDVTVLPNYLDPAIFKIERPERPNITIGWAGSPTHGEDLRVAARAVRKVLMKHRLTELHLFGVDYRWLFGMGRYSKPVSNLWDFYRALDFDIGIAPLVDDDFNRSKSHLKCLEYAALGIPVVASNVAAYQGFVRHGVTGYLASTPEEWRTYLTELVRDPALRRRMGIAAKEYARDYDITRHAHRWAEVYEKAIANAPERRVHEPYHR